MKEIEVKIPDMAKWARELEADFLGARRAGLINIVADVEARAIKGAPKKTSNLANSGSSDVNAEGTRATITFSAPYAEFVHEGTGLYGPHKKMIVPTTKKALFWPGARHPIGAVKGMVGQPFLTDAAEATDPNKLFTEGLNNYLAQNRGQ